jgi:glucose-6-phosphate 1-dehydrogenase
VVRLHAADRDERVGALRDGVRDEVLELAGLVAAECEPGVAVVALRPERRTAELRRQPLQPVDRRGAEEQAVAGKVVEGRQRNS